jgi:hypothetical protein
VNTLAVTGAVERRDKTATQNGGNLIKTGFDEQSVTTGCNATGRTQDCLDESSLDTMES